MTSIIELRPISLAMKKKLKISKDIIVLTWIKGTKVKEVVYALNISSYSVKVLVTVNRKPFFPWFGSCKSLVEEMVFSLLVQHCHLLLRRDRHCFCELGNRCLAIGMADVVTICFLNV